MKHQREESTVHTITISNKDLILRLTGSQGDYLRVISEETGVNLGLRGHTIRFSSSQDLRSQDQYRKVADVIAYLEKSLRRGHEFSSEDIRRVCRRSIRSDGSLSTDGGRSTDTDQETGKNSDALRTPEKTIHLKSSGQKDYVDLIRSRNLCFCVGPAGTGKTYLAMACAVESLVQKRASRIILSRPAVEAGERLGFLPGDLSEKVDPYLRPLQDALFEFLGAQRVAQYYEKNIIEVAPLAFMRGRTLSRSFVILDEAQNTTKEQMYMFLTRIGEGSKVVITGDLSQTDLPSTSSSGLRDAIVTLAGIEAIGVHRFAASDVLRHPLVQKIVAAYEQRKGETEWK